MPPFTGGPHTVKAQGLQRRFFHPRYSHSYQDVLPKIEKTGDVTKDAIREELSKQS